MSCKSLSIEELLSAQSVIIDVRSESEFREAHIPTAVNVPLLNDAQRAEVGTIYKKVGPEAARLRGLEIVGQGFAEKLKAAGLELSGDPSKAFFVVQDFILARHSEALAEESPASQPQVIFYCWRGGDRSKSVALFASLLGVPCAYLTGGHKAFRNYVLNFLNTRPYPFKLKVLYGLTGCGKTKLIQKWIQEGQPAIDLEGLAHHRGSAFGQIGISSLGQQKDFENNLFWEMSKLKERGAKTVTVEGESRRIGRCLLPEAFMEEMKVGEKQKIECSIEERVQNILCEYVENRNEAQLREQALGALMAIRKKLGDQRFLELKKLLEGKNYADFAKGLLIHYYDKMYLNSR